MLMRKFQQLGKNEWWRREKVELLNECVSEWMTAWINKSVPRTGPPLRGEIKSSQVQFLSTARRWLQRKMPWKPYLYRRFNRILKAFSILRISPEDQHIRCPCHHPESKKNLLVFFLFLLPFLLILLSSFPLFLLSFLPFLFFLFPSLPPYFFF